MVVFIPKYTSGKTAENTIQTVPGPTRIAVNCVTDIFELVMPNSIQKIIIKITYLEGWCVLWEKWKELDKMHLHTYLGVLILAEIYKSKDESTVSLWGAGTGRAIWPLLGQCVTYGWDRFRYSITPALVS